MGDVRKELEEVALDTLERFPRAWCETCGKVQPVTLDVMPANEKNPHAAADSVCDECKSIIATLHAWRACEPPPLVFSLRVAL